MLSYNSAQIEKNTLDEVVGGDGEEELFMVFH